MANAKRAEPEPLEGPRSVGALIEEYYASQKFKALAPSTQKTATGVLQRFRRDHGRKAVHAASREALEGIFHGMAETPAAAAGLRKRLRVVFQLGVRLGWRKDNPVKDTEAIKYHVKGFPAWSEDQISAYEARWPSGTRQRLALALLLYTGQRRSDVVRMGSQHVQAERISVSQIKTGARLLIPIHPALRVELDQAGEGSTYLRTQYGQPFSPAGFTGWFVESAVAAGVIGRTPHGLRKAQAIRLAEAGCEAWEIGAITGHTTLSEIEHYTKGVRQGKMADAAMAKLIEMG
jgi:integrase